MTFLNLRPLTPSGAQKLTMVEDVPISVCFLINRLRISSFCGFDGVSSEHNILLILDARDCDNLWKIWRAEDEFHV